MILQSNLKLEEITVFPDKPATRGNNCITVEPVTLGNNFFSVEPEIGGNNIFFFENSCILGQPNASLTFRETCVIESAAKMNPQAQIYLLHSCPIEFIDNEPVYQLLEYFNVKFWRLNVEELISETPWGKWDYTEVFQNEDWSLEHWSDLMRFLLLWKYGGLYMQLDFAVIK